MCEEFYANSNSNPNPYTTNRSIQFMFGAYIGYSHPTTNKVVNEYLLIPYHSSNNDDSLNVAVLKPSSNNVNGFNVIQISIPIIYKQTIRSVFISIGESGVYDSDITFKIYIYIIRSTFNSNNNRYLHNFDYIKSKYNVH